MSGSYNSLNQKYNTLLQRIQAGGAGGSATLQDVLDNGNLATSTMGANSIILENVIISPSLTTLVGAGEINITEPPVGIINGNKSIQASNYFYVEKTPSSGTASITTEIYANLTRIENATDQMDITASTINISGVPEEGLENTITISTTTAGEVPEIMMASFTEGAELFRTDIDTQQIKITDVVENISCQITTNSFDLNGYDGAIQRFNIDTGVQAVGLPLKLQAETIEIGYDPSNSNTINMGWKSPAEDINSTINIEGQAVFTNLCPHTSIEPTFGNDLTNKGYVDRVVGNYSGNGVALYFNIPSANPNPITTYPVSANLQSSLIAVNATPSADYYTLTTPALGTDTLLASFTTDVGYPNLTTIPAGLWSMLIYGYATGSGGNLFYHFHLVEVNSAGSVIATIATSGFSSDVNATSSSDPDSYHASLALVAPYTLASTSSRIRVNLYSTGTGMGGSVDLNTLFGGLYYSFITSTLSATTALLTTNNTWTGTNNFTIGLSASTISTPDLKVDFIDATTSSSILEIGQSSNSVILYGGSDNTIDVDSTTNMVVKDQTAGSNNGNVANTKYVDSAISGLSSVYQTIAGMSAYLTTATASATYQTIAGMSAYLTTATASSTYQTIADMVNYGALAVANTWTLLQTFTTGISTYSITGAVASTAVSLFNTTTGIITMGSSSSTNRIGNLQISAYGLNPTNVANSMYIGGAQFVVGAELGLGASVGRAGPINVGTGQSAGATTSIGNAVNTNKIGSFQMIGNTIENQTATSAINFGDNQTTGAMTIGTSATRSGAITIGVGTCNVNVNGVLNTTTPATNINTTQVPTTAWVNSFYQPLSGMGSYLTTATASATYQTIADMVNYLTTATASSTYATIASLAGYGAKATTNTWDLLQTFTTGINTYSIRGAVAGTSVLLFDTTTGVIDFGAGGQINVGNFRFSGGSLGRGSAGGGIAFGDTQTTGSMDIGTNAGRSGAINFGANSCAINVGGVLNAQQGVVLSADKRITFSTNTANPTATSTILGSVYTGTYTGGVTQLTNGVDFPVSEITNVPIGVYMATGTTNLSSSTSGVLITQPRIQIKNSTNTTYWASGGVPSFTTTAANERTALTCTGVLVVGAVSTIQLILNASSAGNVRCGSDSNNTFQFRLVRIG